eukprot:scaffold226317_cov23-Tisochrysis_lutea.AAC.1
MSTPNNCMRDEDSRGAMLEAEHKGCFDGQQHSTIHRKIKKSIEGASAQLAGGGGGGAVCWWSTCKLNCLRHVNCSSSHP